MMGEKEGKERERIARTKKNREKTEEKEVKEHSQGYQNKYTVRNETYKNDEEGKANKERRNDEGQGVLTNQDSFFLFFIFLSLSYFSSIPPHFLYVKERRERKKRRKGNFLALELH